MKLEAQLKCEELREGRSVPELVPGLFLGMQLRRLRWMFAAVYWAELRGAGFIPTRPRLGTDGLSASQIKDAAKLRQFTARARRRTRSLAAAAVQLLSGLN